MLRAFTAALLTACCCVFAATAVTTSAQARTMTAKERACAARASHLRASSARVRARVRCRQAAKKAAKKSKGSASLTLAPATPAKATPAPPVLSALQQGVVDCANRERAKVGLGSLRVDPALTRAAQAHAQDMSSRSYFDHVSLDGRSPWDRIAAALQGEDPFGTMGENIAAGFPTAEDTCTGWMNSPGHRANILNRDFTAIGPGWADGYAVQDFGG